MRIIVNPQSLSQSIGENDSQKKYNNPNPQGLILQGGSKEMFNNLMRARDRMKAEAGDASSGPKQEAGEATDTGTGGSSSSKVFAGSTQV